MDRAGGSRCTRSTPGRRVRARDLPRALGLPAPRGVPVLPSHRHRACRARSRWVGDAGETEAGNSGTACRARTGDHTPGPGTPTGILRRKGTLRKGSGWLMIDLS